MIRIDEHDADAREAIGATLERVTVSSVVVHRRRPTGWGALCGSYEGQIDDHARPTCPACNEAMKGGKR